MKPEDSDQEAIRVRLTEWLKSKLPSADHLTLSSLTKPGLGFSNETLLGELSWQEGDHGRQESLVFRLEPRQFRVFPEYDLAKQVRVMQGLRETPVPVPDVLWLEEDPSVLGCPFYVMRKIDGEIPPDVPPYHASGPCFDATPERRAKMWWSGLETLAQIHLVDWEGLGLGFLGVPEGATGSLVQQLDYYDGFLRWAQAGEPQPILEAALRWLRDNRFAPERVTFCWGDSRLPNLIFHDDRVVGVLDWEMAFLGDPMADLGWWLFLDWHHSDGNGIPRLDGFPGREETVLRYEELTGWKARNLLYYDIMAASRFGVIMVSLARNLKERGFTGLADLGRNNPATRRLADLLDLPPPGQPGEAPASIDETTVRVQFHLTGPGGHDWYLVVENGEARRYEGTVPNPDTIITSSAADWAAIERGDLDRTLALLRGKLAAEGDITLLPQLDEIIPKLSGRAAT